MTTKSSGFTLIELLVVVAILGIIAAIGITSFSGYVAGAKRKSAENVMQQIALGQTEHYSDNGFYYFSNCPPSPTTSTQIETNLLGGSDNITAEMGYDICTANDATNYKIVAKEVGGTCELTILGNNKKLPNKGC